MEKKKLTWPGGAVIISFWIFSAWYLYTSGLVTQKLNFIETLASILIANLIFVFIFTFYAGTKKGKDILFQEAFGSNSARYFISLLPAITQIGWYAIVIEIGGSALGLTFGFPRGTLPSRLIIIGYAIFTIWIARGGLQRIKKMSYVIIPAMILFSIWSVRAISHKLGFDGLMAYQPAHSASLFIGIQLLIASFISAAVTIPDFLHELENKKKIFLASFWGLIPVTLWVGGLGAALAIVGNSFDVLATLQLMSGPLFVYLLLSIDNLCGAQAAFPIGTGLASIHQGGDDNINEKRRKRWTLIGGFLAVIFAQIGIVGRLEAWLMLLGTVFAPIIGVVLANQYIVKRNFSEKKVYLPALISCAAGSAVSLIPVGIPAIQAMFVSFVVFIIISRRK